MQFQRGRRCADVETLTSHLHELSEVQGAVIECARQPETILHQGHLAGAISGIHPADLRQGGVGLVHH